MNKIIIDLQHYNKHDNKYDDKNIKVFSNFNNDRICIIEYKKNNFIRFNVNYLNDNYIRTSHYIHAMHKLLDMYNGIDLYNYVISLYHKLVALKLPKNNLFDNYITIPLHNKATR